MPSKQRNGIKAVFPRAACLKKPEINNTNDLSAHSKPSIVRSLPLVPEFPIRAASNAFKFLNLILVNHLIPRQFEVKFNFAPVVESGRRRRARREWRRSFHLFLIA